MAIFFMGRLDTYGVAQKLWGVAASLLAKPPHSFWTIALLGAKDCP